MQQGSRESDGLPKIPLARENLEKEKALTTSGGNLGWPFLPAVGKAGGENSTLMKIRTGAKKGERGHAKKRPSYQRSRSFLPAFESKEVALGRTEQSRKKKGGSSGGGDGPQQKSVQVGFSSSGEGRHRSDAVRVKRNLRSPWTSPAKKVLAGSPAAKGAKPVRNDRKETPKGRR